MFEILFRILGVWIAFGALVLVFATFASNSKLGSRRREMVALQLALLPAVYLAVVPVTFMPAGTLFAGIARLAVLVMLAAVLNRFLWPRTWPFVSTRMIEAGWLPKQPEGETPS